MVVVVEYSDAAVSDQSRLSLGLATACHSPHLRRSQLQGIYR
jgi:hypothetical protein